jgi:DNA-3-methyladenine glycosylase I
LLGDPGIVRHRGKIEATIANARATLAIQDSGGSLSELLWAFAEVTEQPPPQELADIPSQTPASRALARRLRQAGFRFLGPTTAYAAMQSLGLVNDHLAGCDFRSGGSPG